MSTPDEMPEWERMLLEPPAYGPEEAPEVVMARFWRDLAELQEAVARLFPEGLPKEAQS